LSRYTVTGRLEPCINRTRSAVWRRVRWWGGYNFFGLHPEIPVEWFDKHVG